MSEKWINKSCIFCEDNSNVKVKFKQNFSTDKLDADVFSARRSTDHYHYQFLECKTHGLVFSSPILPYEDIKNLYQESKQNYDDETAFISKSYVKYIKQNPSLFKNKGKALDIGCGSGFFLKELLATGYAEVFGVEPSREAVSKAGDLKANIFNGTIEESTYEDNTFDLITSFQTLDHLTDPLQVLIKIYNLLKPGGIVYFIVHNEHGLQAKLFGERSPIYDVEHIYLYNPDTLRMICEKAGFKNPSVFKVSNSYPLSYWMRMAPIPLKKLSIKITESLKLSNAVITLKAGNLGVFGRK